MDDRVIGEKGWLFGFFDTTINWGSVFIFFQFYVSGATETNIC